MTVLLLAMGAHAATFRFHVEPAPSGEIVGGARNAQIAASGYGRKAGTPEGRPIAFATVETLRWIARIEAVDHEGAPLSVRVDYGHATLASRTAEVGDPRWHEIANHPYEVVWPGPAVQPLEGAAPPVGADERRVIRAATLTEDARALAIAIGKQKLAAGDAIAVPAEVWTRTLEIGSGDEAPLPIAISGATFSEVREEGAGKVAVIQVEGTFSSVPAGAPMTIGGPIAGEVHVDAKTGELRSVVLNAPITVTTDPSQVELSVNGRFDLRIDVAPDPDPTFRQYDPVRHQHCVDACVASRQMQAIAAEAIQQGCDQDCRWSGDPEQP